MDYPLQLETLKLWHSNARSSYERLLQMHQDLLDVQEVLSLRREFERMGPGSDAMLTRDENWMDTWYQRDLKDADTWAQQVQHFVRKWYPNVEPTLEGIEAALPRYQREVEISRAAAAREFHRVYGREPREEEVQTSYSEAYHLHRQLVQSLESPSHQRVQEPDEPDMDM